MHVIYSAVISTQLVPVAFPSDTTGGNFLRSRSDTGWAGGEGESPTAAAPSGGRRDAEPTPRGSGGWETGLGGEAEEGSGQLVPATLAFPAANSLFPFKSRESRVLHLIGPKDPWDKLFSPRPRFHRLTRGPGRRSLEKENERGGQSASPGSAHTAAPQERPLSRRPALPGGTNTLAMVSLTRTTRLPVP